MSQGQPNLNYPISGSQKFSPIFTGDYAACDEGSYFISTLAATASTAVACTTQALADTNPSIGIINGQSIGGYNIYLRYIKAYVTVVGGSNTTKYYSSVVDNVVTKLTTTGTALGTVSSNTSSSVLSKAILYGGVNIAAAAGPNLRRVGLGMVVGSVETAFDEWVFTFGEPVMGKNLVGAAALSARTVPCGPVILAPGWTFTMGLWGASQSANADTIAWEVGFIERPSGQ